MEIFNIWNDVSSYDGSVESIYDMCCLDDIFYGISLSEFLDKIDNDFNIRDDYFYDSIWGLASTNDIWDVIDIDTLAEQIECNWDNYEGYIYNQELDDFMNEEEEEE